jgi:hypothetical protein
LLFAVGLVAVAATAVLSGRMQSSQRAALMAAAAGGRLADTFGAMGAMAVAAVRRDLPVGSVLLFGVTAGTGGAGG